MLDYAVNFRRPHLYDFNLTKSEKDKFRRSDISIVNTQPKSIFRAYFEIYVGNKVYRSLIEMNLWFALLWVYAAIYKVHNGKYGTYDCTDAIEFIFGQKILPNLDDIDF